MAVRIAACIAALYLVTIPLEGPDLPVYLYPWVEHIRAVGFAEPFGNYSPTSLYVLAAFAALPIPSLLVIKLVALVSVAALAWSVERLARALGSDDAVSAALFALALPTVILNAALGQVDGLWSACCLMALAAAIERRTLAMVAWAALAFAFKAQAAFLAPLMLGIVIRERKWLALAFPPIVYLATIAPAWAAGWPLSDLLTIYLRQGSAWFIGNAPNLWAIPAALGHSATFPLGYALAAAAAVGVTAICSRRELDSEAVMIAALLGAILLPFLLPKMHERYFFLADVLALVMAYRWRERIWLCAFVQAASLLSLVAYLWPAPWLNAAASVPMAAALLMILRKARATILGFEGKDDTAAIQARVRQPAQPHAQPSTSPDYCPQKPWGPNQAL